MKRDAQNDLELCNKATPGPWWIDGNGDIIQTKHITRDVWFIPKTQEDVKFIAESREALPYWIKRSEALNKMLIKAIFDDRGVKWAYEDCLPEKCDYDSMFEYSRIIGAVRMFPFVEIDGEKYFIGDD